MAVGLRRFGCRRVQPTEIASWSKIFVVSGHQVVSLVRRGWWTVDPRKGTIRMGYPRPAVSLDTGASLWTWRAARENLDRRWNWRLLVTLVRPRLDLGRFVVTLAAPMLGVGRTPVTLVTLTWEVSHTLVVSAMLLTVEVSCILALSLELGQFVVARDTPKWEIGHILVTLVMMSLELEQIVVVQVMSMLDIGRIVVVQVACLSVNVVTWGRPCLVTLVRTVHPTERARVAQWRRWRTVACPAIKGTWVWRMWRMCRKRRFVCRAREPTIGRYSVYRKSAAACRTVELTAAWRMVRMRERTSCRTVEPTWVRHMVRMCERVSGRTVESTWVWRMVEMREKLCFAGQAVKLTAAGCRLWQHPRVRMVS